MSVNYKLTNTLPSDEFKKVCIEMEWEVNVKDNTQLLLTKDKRNVVFHLNELKEVYGFRHQGEGFNNVMDLIGKFDTKVISEYEEDFHDLS